MPKLMWRAILLLLIVVTMLTIGGVRKILATGCMVYDYEWTDPETGQVIELSYDGCSDQWTECESGTYQAPDGSCHDIGDGGADTCFPAGTKIEMSDGGQKNIEEVRIGDTVVSQDEWGRRASSRVTQLIQPISDNMCQIEFEDGDKLEVTKSHPLMTDGGWKAIDTEAAEREKESVPVTKLMVGDRMVKVDGTNPIVSAISCKSEQVQTYNLTVDNAHTFFAGGYLAHNKGDQNFDPVCPQMVDCPNPPGTDYNHELTYWSTQKISCNLGTAQAYNGCVTTNAEGVNGCDYQRISTFACCSAGTQSERHWVPAPEYEYTRTNECSNATLCNDPQDQYVSNTACSGFGHGGMTTTTCRVLSTYYKDQTYYAGEDGGGAPTVNCYPASLVSQSVTGCWYQGVKYYCNMRAICKRPDVKVCSCQSICNSTAPTNLSVAQGASGTAATLSWRSGTGGTYQVVYVGSNQSSVENNCAYGGCIISGAVITPFYANSNFSYPVTGMTTIQGNFDCLTL